MFSESLFGSLFPASVVSETTWQLRQKMMTLVSKEHMYLKVPTGTDIEERRSVRKACQRVQDSDYVTACHSQIDTSFLCR